MISPCSKEPNNLWDVLHDEDFGLGSLDHFEIWAPEFFPWVRFTIFIQQAESLARWTADDNIGLGDMCCRVVQNVHDVAGDAVVAEVLVVCADAECIEVVCPYGHEGMPEPFGKP